MVFHHCEHAVILDESFLLKGVCEFKTPMIMPWCRILTNQWHADPHLFVCTVQMYNYTRVRCMYVHVYMYIHIRSFIHLRFHLPHCGVCVSNKAIPGMMQSADPWKPAELFEARCFWIAIGTTWDHQIFESCLPGNELEHMVGLLDVSFVYCMYVCIIWYQDRCCDIIWNYLWIKCPCSMANLQLSRMGGRGVRGHLPYCFRIDVLIRAGN